MDTFRVGTLLEMIRELAYSMADVGLNTRILIQPAMGDGMFKSLPLALSGVMAMAQGMDWEEGLVGSHVNFGEVCFFFRLFGCLVVCMYGWLFVCWLVGLFVYSGVCS